MNKPLAWLLVLLLVGLVPRSARSQERDSAFWAKHSLHRPDSVLLKDSIWFPPHEIWEFKRYKRWTEKAHWRGPGARSFGSFGAYYSAIITLRKDSSFVFDAGFEGGNSLTVGRWTESGDSVVTLQWDPTLSLLLCRDDASYNRYFHVHRAKWYAPWPVKMDGWRFVRRGEALVPYPVIVLQ